MTVGPSGRPLAQCILIVAVVAGLEALQLTYWQATLGMRAAGLQIRKFDYVVAASGQTPIPFIDALRRSIPIALCYTIPFPGTFTMIFMPIALGVSMGMSPFNRAFHERMSGTITVKRGAPDVIHETDLALWWDPSELPVMCAWGRVPDLHERRRARAHRLDGQWALAAIVAVGALGAAVRTSATSTWIAATVIWLVVMAVDETWRIAHHGTVPGYRDKGFTIVDFRTGQTPSTARAFVRSIVVVPLLYVPPLQLLLGFWVKVSGMHRGPHDLIARTVVVEADYVPPAMPTWPPIMPGWIPTPAYGWAPSPGYGWQPAPGWTPQYPGPAAYPVPGLAPPPHAPMPGWLPDPPHRPVPPPPPPPGAWPLPPPPPSAPLPPPPAQPDPNQQWGAF